LGLPLRIEADEPAATELARDALDQPPLEHERLRAAERAIRRRGDRGGEALLRREVRCRFLAVEVRVPAAEPERIRMERGRQLGPGSAQLDGLQLEPGQALSATSQRGEVLAEPGHAGRVV